MKVDDQGGDDKINPISIMWATSTDMQHLYLNTRLTSLLTEDI